MKDLNFMEFNHETSWLWHQEWGFKVISRRHLGFEEPHIGIKPSKHVIVIYCDYMWLYHQNRDLSNEHWDCIIPTWWIVLYLIGSMYAVYGNIYHQYTPHMLAYIPYMDPMGIGIVSTNVPCFIVPWWISWTKLADQRCATRKLWTTWRLIF